MDSLPLEVQILIFERLRKGDLLKSALVCRAWRAVAWDTVMWQTLMIRLSGPLETLLGRDGWWKVINGSFIPDPSDLNRFLAVAAKVTSILLDVTLVDKLVKAMLEVAASTPGKILFPALLTLDCGYCGASGQPQGDLAHTVFAGSPIKSILIHRKHYEEPSVASKRLLSSLLAAHPQIQEVVAHPRIYDIVLNEDRLLWSGGIPEFWRLTDLRSLNYRGYIAYDEWIQLIQGCPKLNQLQVAGYTQHPIPPNPPSVLALSLRRLNLADFSSLDFTATILESTDTPHLMELDLKVVPQRLQGGTEHPSAGRVRSVFRLLAERNQRLQSLTFKTSINLRAEILAAFRSLRRLRITDSARGCQLDDSSVELLCRSLLNLREFHLDYSPEVAVKGDYAKITPKSFGTFARHCTNLTYLGLPVTATKLEDFVGSVLAELVAFRENRVYLVLTTLTLLAGRTKDFVSFLIVQCPKLIGLSISRLNIADREVSLPNLDHLRANMEDVYFSQVASWIAS